VPDRVAAIEPPSLVSTPLNPALQLAPYEFAQTFGDRPLTSIAAVQVKAAPLRGAAAPLPAPRSALRAAREGRAARP
jgi:hypothetical protein